MTVKYKIRDRLLLLPDDHLLPTYQKDHPTYDMMFDPIYKAVGAYAPDRYFVDVGANVGDTAVVMRHNASNPIVCVEGYSPFLLYLRENVEGLADIKIVPAFIGVDEVNGPLTFSSQGGTGRLEVAKESGTTSVLAPKIRPLRSILDEGILQTGMALFKTDTDGMDAFILKEFLKLEQQETALFFECDIRQTLLAERGHAAWRSVFDALRARGYSLVIFDNFGVRIASCRPDRYDLIWDLIAYVDLQFSHESIRVYYLDIWAFPPSMAMIFEECSAHAFALSRSTEPHVGRQQHPDPSFPSSKQVFPSSNCTAGRKPSKWPVGRLETEAQTMNMGELDDWSYWSAQISDRDVDLSRANRVIQEQRRAIELLSARLAELRQGSSRWSSAAVQPFAKLWKGFKK